MHKARWSLKQEAQAQLLLTELSVTVTKNACYLQP